MTMRSPTTVPRLAVERVTFERDRMALLVRVPEGVDASLGVRGADRLLAARPSLAFHTCLNDGMALEAGRFGPCYSKLYR